MAIVPAVTLLCALTSPHSQLETISITTHSQTTDRECMKERAAVEKEINRTKAERTAKQTEKKRPPHSS